MTKLNVEVTEVVFEKCPVCKKGKVEFVTKTSLFVFKQQETICNKCNARFNYEEERDGEAAYSVDLSESKEKSSYENKVLKKSEWERGMSDLDFCIKNDKLPDAVINGLKIILEKGEKTHWYSACILYEEKATSYSTGGAMRVAKGVYVGGSRSHSVGELKKIDNGSLLLTNKRLIFNGGLRSSVIDFKKIIIVEEVEADDGGGYVEIGASNRKKSQIFAVDEPAKWAAYIRMAIKKAK